jgi:hypothetical protein
MPVQQPYISHLTNTMATIRLNITARQTRAFRFARQAREALTTIITAAP